MLPIVSIDSFLRTATLTFTHTHITNYKIQLNTRYAIDLIPPPGEFNWHIALLVKFKTLTANEYTIQLLNDSITNEDTSVRSVFVGINPLGIFDAFYYHLSNLKLYLRSVDKEGTSVQTMSTTLDFKQPIKDGFQPIESESETNSITEDDIEQFLEEIEDRDIIRHNHVEPESPIIHEHDNIVPSAPINSNDPPAYDDIHLPLCAFKRNQFDKPNDEGYYFNIDPMYEVSPYGHFKLLRTVINGTPIYKTNAKLLEYNTFIITEPHDFKNVLPLADSFVGNERVSLWYSHEVCHLDLGKYYTYGTFHSYPVVSDEIANYHSKIAGLDCSLII